jgi:hypothetical protein
MVQASDVPTPGTADARGSQQRPSFRIVRRGERVVAVCGCGWESSPFPTAGLAGAAWDRHAAEAHGN